MPLNMASLPLDFTNLCDISFSQLKLNAQLSPFPVSLVLDGS